MSVYDDIQARIDADKQRAALWPNDESLEGARADIVASILDMAQQWRGKAESYGPEESFVALREIVCQQVLDVLDAELWESGPVPPAHRS